MKLVALLENDGGKPINFWFKLLFYLIVGPLFILYCHFIIHLVFVTFFVVPDLPVVGTLFGTFCIQI